MPQRVGGRPPLVGELIAGVVGAVGACWIRNWFPVSLIPSPQEFPLHALKERGLPKPRISGSAGGLASAFPWFTSAVSLFGLVALCEPPPQ